MQKTIFYCDKCKEEVSDEGDDGRRLKIDGQEYHIHTDCLRKFLNIPTF